MAESLEGEGCWGKLKANKNGEILLGEWAKTQSLLRKRFFWYVFFEKHMARKRANKTPTQNSVAGVELCEGTEVTECGDDGTCDLVGRIHLVSCARGCI
jgi:hypothetical protein